MMVTELNREESKIYDKKDITGQPLSLIPDVIENIDIEEMAIDLANIATELVTKTLGVGAIVAGITSILGGLIVIGGTVKAKK